ncbi:MAG TPA: Coq4 family protein [Alphaproteobacteria bacterium]|nr:Coq4 family protein [Alphaproteobacteria bacterium]
MQGETAQISETGRIRPLAAYRAIRALFKNKEDTGQVFKIVAALQGNSMANCMARFRSSPVGRQVLAENRQLLATLCNREYLRSLPEDSFGRIYHRFLETEGLSAEGLVDASNESPHWEKRQAEFALFASRVRDSHDLNHVLTGYGRNPLGEICVLTFAYPHTRNRGIGVLILAGMFKLKKDLPREIPVFRAILEAYRNGKKAAWLPGVDWEAMLKLPLDEVRRTLNIKPPLVYKGVEARMIELEAEYQRKISGTGHAPQPA